MAIVHIYLDDETINKLVNGETIELNIRSRGDNRIFIKRERLPNEGEKTNELVSKENNYEL